MAAPDRAARPRDRSRVIALTLAVVVGGGAVGWTAAFAGLGTWGLLIGLVLTGILALWLGERHRHAVGLIGGFGLAFLLLTWFPLLWIVVGYVRYVLTGEPIEND